MPSSCADWDHPRVRGEHGAPWNRCPTPPGSSPRARGALAEPGCGTNLEGIIPACAGSTPTRRGACGGGWDHPRVRGEHIGGFLEPLKGAGSSPRARGARPGHGHQTIRRGIIPACAGSTPTRWRSTPVARDHPRVRGEHPVGGAEVMRAQGSSPRARGAPPASVGTYIGQGIIPACAGSTSAADLPTKGCGDHPRVRGEHAGSVRTIDMPPGSSPRARGAPTRRLRGASVAGIIPACAGSTSPADRSPPGARDHPRVRGEHHHLFPPGVRCLGSSPRARGARPWASASREGSGIIPACAGSTQPSPAATAARGDHPRVRGEHPHTRARARGRVGSSPRARGAHHLLTGLRRVPGIIPACAGSTAVGECFT